MWKGARLSSTLRNGAATFLSTIRAEDVTATLALALEASGLDQIEVAHRSRLLSDNGLS
jgi:hypothetical protein